MSNNEISSHIKLGNQDIYGIYLGDQLIEGVYLGYNDDGTIKTKPIWQVIRGTLDGGDGTTTEYEYIDGIVTFRGNGTIPVIEDGTENTAIQNLFDNRKEVKEIIVEDSVTEISVVTDQSDGAFGCFYQLEKITLPFIGKNAKSELEIYPFGSIFKGLTDSNDYYQVDSSIINGASSKTYYIPTKLKTVILNGGQYNGRELKNNCFVNCSELTKIYVSDKITTIYSGSFYKCKNLQTLTLPFIGEHQLIDRGLAQGFGWIFAGNNFSTEDYFKVSVPTTYCNNYNSYNTPQTFTTVYIPKELKNINILKGGIPAFGLNGVGNINDGYENCPNIKFLSIDNSCQDFYRQESYGAGSPIFKINSLYIPSSIQNIGRGYNGKVYNVYFQGTKNQFNILKNRYAQEYGTAHPLFEGSNIIYNATPNSF